MTARARSCPPVPPRNLHGKEGVDGSSPSEGFNETPANQHFIVADCVNRRTQNGHISATRDVVRRPGSLSDTAYSKARTHQSCINRCVAPMFVATRGSQTSASHQRGGQSAASAGSSQPMRSCRYRPAVALDASAPKGRLSESWARRTRLPLHPHRNPHLGRPRRRPRQERDALRKSAAARARRALIDRQTNRGATPPRTHPMTAPRHRGRLVRRSRVSMGRSGRFAPSAVYPSRVFRSVPARASPGKSGGRRGSCARLADCVSWDVCE